jgi:hypothetical protein
MNLSLSPRITPETQSLRHLVDLILGFIRLAEEERQAKIAQEEVYQTISLLH